MKFSIISTTMALAMVSATPTTLRGSVDTWAPGGPGDMRGPCPMLNTLANHGFLHHDGDNLDRQTVVGALVTALNFNESIATVQFEQALVANPTPNATYFTLDMLNVHNVLEHDSSISRLDAHFGNNHVFNPEIFATTRKYWTNATLTAVHLANGKMARQLASKTFNPNYTFTASNENFSLGEMAAPLLVFGDIATATVDRNLVTYFFENERLPVALGWQKQKTPITIEQVVDLAGKVAKAAKLLTDDGTPTLGGRADSHFGRLAF